MPWCSTSPDLSPLLVYTESLTISVTWHTRLMSLATIVHMEKNKRILSIPNQQLTTIRFIFCENSRSDRYSSLFSVKLILDILICVVAPDSASAPLRFMGRLGSGRVVGRLGFRVWVSASYSYFQVSRKITTFVIREKFSRKTASIVNYNP